MAEQNKSDFRAYFTEDVGVTHLASGESVVEAVVHAHAEGMSPQEVQQFAAEGRGMEPEHLELLTPGGDVYARAKRAGGVSMGFMGSRWRASWDPHAERAAEQSDPSLN